MSRYAAFISYSHSDDKVARWLHRALEGYRIPRSLIGKASPFGPVSRKLPPVFRDRDELPASGDLGIELRGALAESRFQIVMCSPKAARSHWVNEEILAFKRTHGEHRTLAVIVAGEPNAGDDECFPPALHFKLAPDGTLGTEPAEPIAADLRPGKDGRRLALLKLVAGIAGVPLDALARRDATRRQRKLIAVALVSSAIAVVTIGLAVYAEAQRRVAERQQRLADRSLQFLIGTFEIANPATENPRTITALTILQRASRRAAVDLDDEPAVSARLLRATGEIYANLGLATQSSHDLQLALSRLPPTGAERARIQLELARLAYIRRDALATERAIDAAQASYRPRDADAKLLDAKVADWRGRAAVLTGDYARSATLLGEAGRRYALLDGDYRGEIGTTQLDQATSLLRLHRLAEADRIYAAATRNFIAKFGLNHVSTASAIRNRALSDFEGGRLPSAERRIEAAMAIYRRVLEPDHPIFRDALVMQGRILTAAGQTDQALAALADARALTVRLYGPTNSSVGDVDFYTAEAEAAAGRPDAALARADRVKAIYDASYGPNDPDQAELLALRARIFAGAGRQQAAAWQCDLAIALRVRLAPDDRASRSRSDCAPPKRE
ncbi:toll/interleukin-1 receptor domain-containing protein [Sphingomonas phyllosphaerae]|uniref:toll/interleukin-1 receptor domain-containing protein n=1 Tax=Sphingomonas phyllosphaerae TaxID=257003 RepID=UPI0004232E4B|nr:toll/interleukin-1 receptor domain-containing protein [Sphingomonas phyllosphaerae]